MTGRARTGPAAVPRTGPASEPGPDAASRFLDGPLPLAFAHRGGMGLPANVGVENTVAAFGRALALGFRHLETDVRATADGVAVLVHDSDLARLTAGQHHGSVGDLDWPALSRLRVGGREPFARLDEVLDTFSDAMVNVDVKDDDAVGPFLSALRRTRAAPRVGVAAFSTARALRLRRALGPAVSFSATPPEVAGWLAHSAIPLSLSLSLSRSDSGSDSGSGSGSGRRRISYQVPERIGGRQVVTARTISTAHRMGRQVHVWTVDDPVRMRTLLDVGVDGIVTDRPELLREVLIARGSWHGG